MTDEATIEDKKQLAANITGLVGEMNAAALHAATFAKKALEGADPAKCRNDGPTAKVMEMALKSLEVASMTAEKMVGLSSLFISLNASIREDLKGNPRALTEEAK
jgi:hypothetical protein